ncbi:cold shock domain-containing protein, partial [Moraxella catarrhalis]|uniref:cold shock domain-containing protein n=3 Tax=Moraxella catarrhalis TaxID=480 RepID=UPI000AB5D274
MNTQKYIGTVLWFGTANGAKYGFIKYNDEPGKNQSIFFHKNKISKPSSLNLHKFIKDQTVTFYIKESDKDNSKNEAYNILLLEDEEDKKFVLTIFFLLLNKDKHNKLYQNIRSTVKRNIDHYLQFNDILDQELLQIVSDNQKIDELSIFYNYI